MSQQKLSDINFFVSSTYVDMKEHRDAVIKDLQTRAGVINAQEFFGSRDKKPLETCLEELEQSHVFIMFLGPRYGTIEPSTEKSFVESEYERAGKLDLPRFAYIMDEDQPFPVKHVSIGIDAERLKKFKARVRSELTVSPFTSPEDLAQKVYSDLVRELPKHGFLLGRRSDINEISQVQLIEEFLLLPKLFYGRKVSFEACLGASKRVSEDECSAFSYDYGSAVGRSIEASDPSLRRILRRGRLTRVLAEGERAAELLSQPKGLPIQITVKLLQGSCRLSTPIYDLEIEPGVYDTVASELLPKKRVIVGFREKWDLLTGLELVEVCTGKSISQQSAHASDNTSE